MSNIKVGDWVRVIGDGGDVVRVQKVDGDFVVVDGFWENISQLDPVSDHELKRLAVNRRDTAKAYVAEADEIDAWLKAKEKA